MHIALIMDAERLGHEQRMLNRLTIGLIGEGVQVTRVVPEDVETLLVDEARMALAARVTAPMRVLPWSRRERARRLAEVMVKGPPDVLYAVGMGAWPLAMDLGRVFARPVALDLWTAEQVRRVPRGRAAATVAAYVAPTAPIAALLAQRVAPELVCVVPMGVKAPPRPRPVLSDPEDDVAIAVIGSGRDVPAYRAMLGGLRRVVRQTPRVRIFLELHGPREHEIWRLARHLEMLEHVSTITEAGPHRALLTRCDVLLNPEQFGAMRTILLEAMSAGMPVVSADDPLLDMIVDAETAVVVDRPDVEAWSSRVRSLLADPEAARRIGAGGRARILAGHRSSDQITRLLGVFQRIVTGEVYRFEAAT